MMAELILTNAHVVTIDDIVHGTVIVRDGMIASLDDRLCHIPSAIDLGGDYVIPGLVELHTDNLEKHVAPRPKVRWPMAAAVLAHDAQIAAAGITTVFDALTVGEVRHDTVRAEMLHGSIAAIVAGRRDAHFRADHFIHLRCEVAHDSIIESVAPLLEEPLVRLVSLMDHTPGQRQFVTVDKYYEYYQGKFGYSDAEMASYVAARIDQHQRFAAHNRRALAALCGTRGLPKASHDDATIAHIEEAVGFGVTIAEFPTTREAAEAAGRRDMAVVMGAPNVVRGGSHSGNISAADLASDGLLDILSSDYVPFSLLHAAFLLHDKANMPLHRAIAKVSINPARALGLHDRGEIAPGKRGDLAHVAVKNGMPMARRVWREGERIV